MSEPERDRQKTAAASSLLFFYATIPGMHNRIKRPRSFKHHLHRFQKFWDVREELGIIGTLGRAYGTDQSRWEPRFHFDRAQPGLIDFVIIKASQDDQWKDPAFEQLYIDIQRVLVRGAYHYVSSGIDGVRQADHFLRVIGSKNFQILVADFEGYGNTLNDAFVRETYRFLQRVKAERPAQRVLLYTNPNLYDNYIYPAALRLWGRDVFADFELWIAQYPWVINLDGQPAMPKNRRDWRIWQFSDAGDPVMHGTDGHVDRNIFNGSLTDLHVWAGTLQDPDRKSTPFEGAVTYQGERYGWNFSLDILDPGKLDFEVFHASDAPDGRASVSWSSIKRGAVMGFNGGDWDKKIIPYRPIDYAVSNGVVLVPDSGLGRPSLLIYPDGSMRIDHQNKGGVRHALTGLRYIVRDGKSPAYLDGSEAQYTEGHARTCIGLDRSGHLVVWTNDGQAYNKGLLLKQVSVEMIRHDVLDAFDVGGGGDTVRVLRGEVTNQPQDGWERPVPEHLHVIQKEINMPIGEYEVISNSHDLSLRTLHQVSGSTKLLSIPKGTQLQASEIWIAPETTSLNQQDDVWAFVTYSGRTGWVGLVHLGVVYGTYKPVGDPPPAGKTYTVSISVTGYKPITLTGTLEPEA